MKIKTGVEAESINFRPVLFVEGSGDSIDVTVLEKVLNYRVKVKPLGMSSNIKGAAFAFRQESPYYYFLIDRDHYDDSVVNKYWKNFPDADTPNLLMWKKRELENYFIDPVFLASSVYQKKGIDKLRSLILKSAKKRLFMSVVNQVIISVREDFKQNWVEIFSDPSMFSSQDAALKQLISLKNFSEFKDNVGHCVKDKYLKESFDKYLNEMTGGKVSISWEAGRWLDLIPGKEILNEVLNSNCFVVKNANNKILQGKAKFDEIINDLLSKDLPEDFNVLKGLIEERIKMIGA